MRDDGERTVAVMDELKKRRDILVEDADLQAACCASGWSGGCSR